ncbi:PTS system cellobiose-specific IIB component [Scopulibacillus darangshiensis]|uniref:PTS system cellobiose-specific IIB component n=1 Tax=Scopulibacillus darangshiensis TaxID=442528 RepID=A0A4R2PAT1_9BACL|nr:PTS sugar transporter subunit IIB [Scopulibacillus darangshiensis]TCP31211.1 PTS system cellobiose-specific IIB component [Scopulibacillus darangshiensis]
MTEKNILLVCGGGASSGFMAQNIRKAAKKRNIELNVIARSESEVDEYVNDIHVLLIGPHLKYMEEDLKTKVQPYNIPVAVIPQNIYGLMDGNKGLDLILELLGEK